MSSTPEHCRGSASVMEDGLMAIVRTRQVQAQQGLAGQTKGSGLCSSHDAQIKELPSGKRRQDGKLVVKGVDKDG